MEIIKNKKNNSVEIECHCFYYKDVYCKPYVTLDLNSEKDLQDWTNYQKYRVKDVVWRFWFLLSFLAIPASLLFVNLSLALTTIFCLLSIISLFVCVITLNIKFNLSAEDFCKDQSELACKKLTDKIDKDIAIKVAEQQKIQLKASENIATILKVDNTDENLGLINTTIDLIKKINNIPK